MRIGQTIKRLVAMSTAVVLFLGCGVLGAVEVRADEAQTIEYQGSTIVLSESALYVDQTLTENSAYKFKSLQDAVAAAKPGTKENPTVIYLAPDVYWTDDYTNPEVRAKDDLIGLIIPQAYITLVGMTGNPDDVVIASDRGQNAGANGNFNTIGVGDGFHAKDLTIGNYCNIDLVFERDPSKNHTKRQESITQAQAVTKAPDVEDMDEWFFENCNIVSRLNLFSRDDRPKRSLLLDCHLECTDDSLGTGYISIFVNCDIELYSNTPCGGASHYMQAFLGCEFKTQLTDKKIITLCKNTKPFAFIDCAFSGDMTGMEWKQNELADDLRQIVYNNTLNGQPLTISPSRPELSVTPNEEQLKAFKVGDVYNVYNLLNGAGYEEWDPLNQKDTMPVSAWNIQFDYPGITKDVAPQIEGNSKESLEITPVVLGGTDKNVTWSVSDDTLKIETTADGHAIVTGTNETTEDKTAYITAKTANGMEKVLHFVITPHILEAPGLKDNAVTLSKPTGGKIEASYAIADESIAKETTLINWYKADTEDGANKILIAQTTYVKDNAAPFSVYTLRTSDIGKYIFCEVMPGRTNTKTGAAVLSAPSKQITSADVAKEQKTGYDVDLEHLTYIPATNDTLENNFDWTNDYIGGNWYGGFYLPAEYRTDGVYNDKIFKLVEGEAPYTFAAGASGAAGTFGLQTTTQGARLVYVDDIERGNMKLTLTMSPHKTAAQGFGSAKQFMDIFFKYDQKTMTGYGLRITRVPSIEDPALADFAAKSCTFTLMQYENGVATPLGESVVSTAFLPGCTVVLTMEGNVLKADVTTTTAQGSEYPEAMPHEVHLSYTFEGEVNTFGGFGFQHTGTAGAGKSGNRTTIHTLTAEYPDVIVEEPIEEPVEEPTEKTKDNGLERWIPAVVAVIAIGGLGFFLKKKKSAK